MLYFYFSLGAAEIVLWTWCSIVWRERCERIFFLRSNFIVCICTPILSTSLYPFLGPTSYAWLYLALGVAGNVAASLVLVGIFRHLRPPVWILLASGSAAMLAVTLVWQGAWLSSRVTMVFVALGMALALSCSVGAYSDKRQRDLGRARECILTGLSIFFGVQFTASSGLIGYLFSHETTSLIESVGAAISCLPLAWGLRAVPEPSAALLRAPEQRLMVAAQLLWKEL